jgi:group II intron reverse transcriptase/maturase
VIGEGSQVNKPKNRLKVCAMQKAENVFAAMHKLGKTGQPLTRVYRQLFNVEMYLGAYAKLYPNRGALTQGTDEETADGMNLKRIEAIIEEMRYERFKWTPVRRIYIRKKNGKKRPLGIPSFRDRLVQEVIRAILSAYYEPQFSKNSHGFRPKRGCHTALEQIYKTFRGAAWFIEGDIKGCFDNIDHDILMTILSKKIHDGRLLNLIKAGLKAGIMEDWQYQRTLSGTPQGGVLSPLLANIYLNELDAFMEIELIPKWNRGKGRRRNKAYQAIRDKMRKAKVRKDIEELYQLKAQLKQLPSLDTMDPNFRRLRYVRYADDYLIGFIGSKNEAGAIKAEIATFLKQNLNLTQSKEKTLITHAKTQKARFLGYAVSIYHVNDKLTLNKLSGERTRSINGMVRLGVPKGLVREKIKPFMRNCKVIGSAFLTNLSVAEIVQQYQAEYRGIAEYYKFAVNRNSVQGLFGVMQESLAKTIANKEKIRITEVFRRYKDAKVVNGKTYMTLAVSVETKNGIRKIEWGGIPLTRLKEWKAAINDELPKPMWTTGGELVRRLQANQCEICESTQQIEVHHVRKLSDLKRRWQGRKEKPTWVKLLVSRRRKTLIVCRQCHLKIHHGRMDKPRGIVDRRAV